MSLMKPSGAKVIMPRPEPFSGKELVIIPDPDDTGHKSSQKLFSMCQPLAQGLAIFSLEEGDLAKRLRRINPKERAVLKERIEKVELKAA